jgi:hypothetical protein
MVVFSVQATNVVSYQWRLNGNSLTDDPSEAASVRGATSSRLILRNVDSANGGRYSCVVTNGTGSVTSSIANLIVSASAAPSRLTNVSCRSLASSGDNALITGFVVAAGADDAPAKMAVRASGPALYQFGVSGFLRDPRLDLYDLDRGSTPIATRLAPATNGNGAPPSLLGSDLAPRDGLIAQPLVAANYSANVTSPTGGSGVAMIEVNDLDADTFGANMTRLVNCSGRAQVGRGNDVLVTGFVIGGGAARTVLLRASGPALARYGVQGTLADPKVALYTGNGTLLATNDDWQGDTEIADIARAVGAFGWSNRDSKDAALLITLPPGAYTAQVSGADGGTGVAIVEVYDTR